METLLSFIVATALLAISPGPDNIYVLIQSIANGVKYGLATVYGLISGCIVHTTLVAFGVSAIIKENENLFLALKIFGASYLVFLAYKVYKSSSKIDLSSNKKSQKSTGQLFKQGFIMNVLNPKVSIFFLAFFPAFLFSDELSTVTQFFVLGLVFMAVSLVIFSLIAVSAGQIANYLKSNKKIGLILKWLQIVVFIGIAIFILFS
ncbi:LysE family translocator [Aureibaculum sp. 2210JD6-5]|uniref:LysE family translocator n=1 Tax=Aureibaculum sp. 2210JD6-5 TaxID=3103957 RepID=UPI002AAE7186|nr:LysE family translocator [Aureibaculum sp. 2210JD6-5]MDY7395286.1 LysE family translocator [Aureibaculum sp. 2210JD6-5]